MSGFEAICIPIFFAKSVNSGKRATKFVSQLTSNKIPNLLPV